MEHSLCLEKNRTTDAEPPASRFPLLPAAGYRNDSSLNNAGSNGNYWSSSLNTNNPNNAYNLNFNSDNVDWNNNNRYIGFTVRPVCQ